MRNVHVWLSSMAQKRGIPKLPNDESVRPVCYSPKKRASLQQAFASQSPVQIVGTKKNSKKKRFNADTEDHCITKHARITCADHLSFLFNPSIGNHLHTVKRQTYMRRRSQSEDRY